ncbi:diaminopimelate decarboxylase [bacterium]|nr:diaminopimelate decarboxylase [bacterium]
MEAFTYRRGELHAEGVPLRRLAAEFGTPLYVYSQGHVVGQYRAYGRAFTPVDHLVCYAVKANTNGALIRALAQAGAGFDIVSAGELHRIVRAGGDPRRCVFAGVGKTWEEIATALRLGVYSFNVESEAELSAIAHLALRTGRRAPIALRVNPGVDPDTHHYISTGRQESKFGIPLSRALAVYRQARCLPGLTIRGIQMHIGSQITRVKPYVQAVRKMLPLIDQVRALAPDTLEFFGLGGGLGIRYRRETPPTPQALARSVLPLLRRSRLKILLEPGRSIAGNGGLLLTRVLYVKRTPAKTFVIVDASMAELIRPALYHSYHEIVPVITGRGRRTMVADVVGPVCESGDFLAQGRRLARVEAGELLAVRSAGAYGMVMASNYNSRPLPAEVLVHGRRAACVRRRQSVRDLVRDERRAPWL